MLRTVLSLTLVLLFFTVKAQVVEEDRIVSLAGKILNSEDSSGVTARITYEKLPYYDDVGVINSEADGSFEIPLVGGNSYAFSISKEGYDQLTREIEVAENADAVQSEVFFLKSDKVELIKLDNLIFARSSPEISSSSYSELDDLANWMIQNPSVAIQLEGHTDFRGNAKANLELSQARVDAVKTYLTKKGVKKNRILTKAFGGTQPISREDTEEAKTLNRRVEVRVIRR